MDTNAIVAFFNEISQEATLGAISILPSFRGFRPKSEQGVYHQIQQLAKRLTVNAPQKAENVVRDFDVIGFASVSWGVEHLGDAQVIHDYVRRSQERESEDQDKEEANADEALVVELFDKLRGLTHQNKCARADVRRFFEFGPFSDSECIRSLIDSCNPAEEVAHNKKLAMLPSRFEIAEKKIADLYNTVAELVKQDKARSEMLAMLRKNLDGLKTATTDSSETASRIQERLDAVLAEIALQKKAAASEVKAREQSTQAVVASIETFQSHIVAIMDQIEPLTERSAKAGEAITNIREELDQVRKSITEICAMVDRLSTEEQPIGVESSGTETQEGAARLVTLEKLRGVERGKPASLQNGAEFVRAVTVNLEALNIKKSSAEPLALECVAALMAGQMPYFAGLNGKRTAEACTIALAARDTHVLTVPVGLSSPNEFRRRLDSLFAKERQNVGCVIIEGINRSALDAFGESLVGVISRQRSGDRASRSLLMMATLTDGPASLPFSVAHVSLGPIFHIDTLEWRSRQRGESQVADGAVSAEMWEGACNAADGATPDAEEALRMLNEFVPVANPLLRGAILSGVRTLSALQDERTVPTALQSLAFGWLAPLCIAVGASLDAVDQEFDKGLVDGTVPDTRLANLLRTGLFDSVQRGGV